MADRLALLEIMASDQDEFAALAQETGLELTSEGESSGLDGTTLLAFSCAVAPPILSIIELLLRKWLDRRKSIQIKVNGAVIEADSPDELEHLMTALRGTGE